MHCQLQTAYQVIYAEMGLGFVGMVVKCLGMGVDDTMCEAWGCQSGLVFTANAM